ncbi:MAG: AI-2E family transporter [Anaerolineales bacterium]
MDIEAPSDSAPTSLWPPRRIILSTLIVLLVGLGFWLLVSLRLALFSLFIAIVISTAMTPAVDWLNRRGLSRAWGVGIVYLGMLAALLAFGWLMAPVLIEQAVNIAESYSLYYQSLRNQLLGSASSLIRRLAFQLPVSLSLERPAETAGEALGAMAQALNYSALLGNSLFTTVAVFLLAFFWTLERKRSVRGLLLLLPLSRREEAQALFVEAEKKVGAYMRGLAFLSLAVGSTATIAYFVMGLPYALLLGILAGLFEVVPLIGPALGAIPAVMVAVSVDPDKTAVVIGVNIAIQFLENTFLAPRVMDKAVGVNPVVALLALAAFGSLFGLQGALLAIPLAAIGQLLIDRFLLGPKEAEESMPAGRGALSVLRYEARQFVQDMRKQVRQKDSHLDEASDQVEETLETVAQDLDSLLARVVGEEEQA